VDPTDTAADRVERLVDEVFDSIRTGLLPVAAMNDAAVHRREMERIFARAWVFVGHESEIPSRGDYVKRHIGPDAFVLVRGEDDQVRLLFDSCRHRGAMVCRADKGNASYFRCSYHGWTYKNTGELAGAPLFKAAYGDRLDKGQWGLFAAPHVESLHGFVFASLDPAAPSLADYLGPMKWYFDMEWGQCRDGFEVIGEPQRWVMDANWKTGAENFGGDTYHTVFLHRSMLELGLLPDPRDQGGDGLEGYHVRAGNGHSLSYSLTPPDAPGPRFWNYPPEVVELFTPDAFGEEMYEFARHSVGHNGTIFPNTSFLAYPLMQTPRLGPQALKMFRVFNPLGPAQMEIVNWFLCPRGTPEPFRTVSQRSALGTFGSSGIFEQDDSEPWSAITRTGGTVFARKVGMRINYQMSLAGVGDSKRDDAWSAPGVAYRPAVDEGSMRGFWRRWAQFMRAGRYPLAMTPEEQDGDVPTATDVAG
jgi:phenylpropionate dioxygenase-like ring-hydroxylating dioxygenase large terminal subunit